MIINKRQSVSVILNALFGVSVLCKLRIQPDIVSDSTYVESR